MSKYRFHSQKSKGLFISVLLLFISFIFLPAIGHAQGSPKIKVTKKTNDKYGAGGFEKSFTRRNVEIKLIHDKYNYPREEIKTFTYPDGSYKINTWNFDLASQLDHFSSYYYNAANTKLGTVEAYYTNNRLQNAYGIYTEDGNTKTARYDLKAGRFLTYDLGSRSLDKYSIKLEYNNMKRVISPAASTINTLIKRKDYSETIPDNTYPNGTKKTIVKGDHLFGDGIEEFYDANNVLRKKVYHEFDEEYEENYIETIFYDCNGQIEHVMEEYRCPDCGMLMEIIEIDYENGKPVRGYRDYQNDFDGYWENEEYDPETDSFVDSRSAFRSLTVYMKPKLFKDVKTLCSPPGLNDFKRSNFYAGPSIAIDNNGTNSLSLFGGKLSYQYNPCYRGAVTLDLEAHFTSNNSVNFRQLGVYAGGAYAPVKSASYISPLTWTVRAQVGYTNFNTKSGSNNNSTGNFTIGAGTGFEYNFDKSFLKGIAVFPYYRLNLGKGKNFSLYNVSLLGRF